jgi:hypothetical protein
LNVAAPLSIFDSGLASSCLSCRSFFNKVRLASVLDYVNISSGMSLRTVCKLQSASSVFSIATLGYQSVFSVINT